jgi:hypothetical protein
VCSPLENKKQIILHAVSLFEELDSGGDEKFMEQIAAKNRRRNIKDGYQYRFFWKPVLPSKYQ